MARKKGSKLSRTEVFNVRFDPKLKMAAELLAARERRTLSSLTEWVMERAVKEMPVLTNVDGHPVTAWQVADKCWEHAFIWKVFNLAMYYPELLNHVERRVYMLTMVLKDFEKHLSGDGSTTFWSNVASMVDPYIVACAEGEIEHSELNRHYQEARMQFLAKIHKSGNKQLRELANSGTLDQYPEAKKLVFNLIGKP
jgi:hypothetical protein